MTHCVWYLSHLEYLLFRRGHIVFVLYVLTLCICVLGRHGAAFPPFLNPSLGSDFLAYRFLPPAFWGFQRWSPAHWQVYWIPSCTAPLVPVVISRVKALICLPLGFISITALCWYCSVVWTQGFRSLLQSCKDVSCGYLLVSWYYIHAWYAELFWGPRWSYQCCLLTLTFSFDSFRELRLPWRWFSLWLHLFSFVFALFAFFFSSTFPVFLPLGWGCYNQNALVL